VTFYDFLTRHLKKRKKSLFGNLKKTQNRAYVYSNTAAHPRTPAVISCNITFLLNKQKLSSWIKYRPALTALMFIIIAGLLSFQYRVKFQLFMQRFVCFQKRFDIFTIVFGFTFRAAKTARLRGHFWTLTLNIRSTQHIASWMDESDGSEGRLAMRK